jgi:hypothetical protein
MSQPSYSWDLVLCNFFLFPKLKGIMKGWRFTTIDDIKTGLLEDLKATPKKLIRIT